MDGLHDTTEPGEFGSIPAADSLRAPSVAQRRTAAAYALAANGGAVSPGKRPLIRADDLATRLGCTPDTVRHDWRRDDVRQMAARAALAGFAPALLGAARHALLLHARRAMAGDVASLGVVLDALKVAGLVGPGGGALVDPVAAVDMPGALDGIDGGDVFAGAAEELAAILAEIAEADAT